MRSRGAWMEPPTIFRRVPREATGCVSYVIADPAAGACAIIDPPEDLGPVLAESERIGIRPSLVLETHTHADHLSGARALAARLGIPVHLPFLNRAAWSHESVRDGQEVRIGDVRLRAIHTPGHTPCSMTFLLQGRAFVGDALLPGTAGRADFYDEGPEEMYHSLFDKLLRLDDSVEVYAAHHGPRHGLPNDPFTTIGKERRTNEALTQKTKEDFIRYMTEGWPPKPAGWEEIIEKNIQP